MDNNKKIGNFGENIAAKYLQKKGYLILARNHKEKFYEIDIIAREREGVLIFCEVKTIKINISTYSYNSNPEDNMSVFKLKKLTRAVELFIAKHPQAIDEEKGWQIDLVAVTITEGRTVEIRHYENV